MRDELEIVKWWFVVGIAAVTFQKLAKISFTIWKVPQTIQDIFS
jgi:hypothetical protein